MLLPRFTIRSLLGLTVLAALVAWVLQQSVQGALWAQCAAWTLVFVGLLFAAYATLFLAAWCTGQILGIVFPTHMPVDSPFASATPPGPVGASPFAEPQAASSSPEVT